MALAKEEEMAIATLQRLSKEKLIGLVTGENEEIAKVAWQVLKRRDREACKEEDWNGEGFLNDKELHRMLTAVEGRFEEVANDIKRHLS